MAQIYPKGKGTEPVKRRFYWLTERKYVVNLIYNNKQADA